MDTKTTSPTSSSRASSSKLIPAARIIGAGLWLAVLGAGAASAQTFGEPAYNHVKAPVAYGDLNLSTQHGAKTLLARIERAADDACGELTHSSLFPREGAHHRKCVTEAVDAAVAQVNAPTLTALYRAQPDVTLASR